MRAALIATLLLAPAHGTNGVYAVYGNDGAAVSATEVGHGLAAIDPQGRWRFLCPTLWAGTQQPLALGVPGTSSLIVVGADRAYHVSNEAIAEPRTAAGINEFTVRRLIRAGDTVLVHAATPDASVIYAFDDASARPVLEDSPPIKAIAPAGGEEFYAATTSSASIMIDRVLLDGTKQRVQSAPLANIEGATITLEHTGGELYAGIYRPADFRLVHLDENTATTIATATVTLVGPVNVSGELFVIDRFALAKVGAGGVERVDTTRMYNCLTVQDAVPFACAGREIYKLGEGGALVEKVFAIADVKGPRLAHLDTNAQAACEFEWVLFAGELGLDPSIPSEVPDGGVVAPLHPGDCSCETAGARSSSVLDLLLAVATAASFRRRR